jgi:hypothetical protein
MVAVHAVRLKGVDRFAQEKACLGTSGDHAQEWEPFCQPASGAAKMHSMCCALGEMDRTIGPLD